MKFNFRADEKLIAEVTTLAKAKGLTTSAFLRDLVKREVSATKTAKV